MNVVGVNLDLKEIPGKGSATVSEEDFENSRIEYLVRVK